MSALITAIANSDNPDDPTGQNGYDYAADPKGLKREPEAGANPKQDFPAFELSGETYYRHFIKQFNEAGEEEDVFKTPIHPNKVFISWSVAATPVAPITIPPAKQNPFDYVSWSISLPDILEDRVGPYLQLMANWADDPEVAPAKVAVQEKLDEVKALMTEAAYKDDYVVGGPVEGDLKNLQDLLTKAAELLQGKAEPVTITNIDDGGGTSTTKVGEVIVYELAELQAINAQIDAEVLILKQKQIPIAVYSQVATIPYPTDTAEPPDPDYYDYKSVTIAQNGWYEIELWGATGGPVYTKEYDPNNPLTALGGVGGHVKARVKLKEKDVLKVFIGGAGGGSATYDPDKKLFTKIPEGYNLGKAGGKPNGGNGYTSSVDHTAGGSGGGGSTDVRLLKDGYDKTEGAQQGHGLGTWSNVYTSTIGQRILVAGGGGGAAQGTGGNYGSGPWPGLQGGNPGKTGVIGVGAGYDPSTSNDGKGVAGGRWNVYEGSGGGGGGYVGGGAVTGLPTSGDTSTKRVAAGGGGSNFPSSPSDSAFPGDSIFTDDADGRSIENLLTTEATEDKDDYLSTFYGNGKATITWAANQNDPEE